MYSSIVQWGSVFYYLDYKQVRITWLIFVEMKSFSFKCCY